MDLRESILSLDDAAKEKVATPEWQPVDAVYVRTMDGHQRSKWAELAYDENGEFVMDAHKSRLLVFTVCDEAGKLLFKPEDFQTLEQRRGDVLLRLWAVARKLNGMLPEQAEADEKK